MEDAEGYKTVIVATGRNWPDALGGATLAGVLDAPILLVDTDALPAAVAAEITRLKATRAIVLGGTAAVSANVATAIDAIPGVAKVERIGGANRYLTSEMIAKRAPTLQDLATSTTWPSSPPETTSPTRLPARRSRQPTAGRSTSCPHPACVTRPRPR